MPAPCRQPTGKPSKTPAATGRSLAGTPPVFPHPVAFQRVRLSAQKAGQGTPGRTAMTPRKRPLPVPPFYAPSSHETGVPSPGKTQVESAGAAAKPDGSLSLLRTAAPYCQPSCALPARPPTTPLPCLPFAGPSGTPPIRLPAPCSGRFRPRWHRRDRTCFPNGSGHPAVPAATSRPVFRKLPVRAAAIREPGNGQAPGIFFTAKTAVSFRSLCHENDQSGAWKKRHA